MSNVKFGFRQAVAITTMLAVLSLSLFVLPANAETYSYSDQWLLLEQVHCPPRGSTSLTTGLTYSAEYYFAGFGSTASVSYSTTIAPQNGQCCAYFQKVQWCYHEWWILFWHYEEVYINQVYPYSSLQNIYSSSTDTCNDDLNQIYYNGIYSNTFDSRYVTTDTQFDNNADTWFYYTRSATGGSYVSSGLSVTVGIPGFGVSTAVYSNKNTATSTWQCTYGFAPHHSYYVDCNDNQQNLWFFHLNW